MAYKQEKFIIDGSGEREVQDKLADLVSDKSGLPGSHQLFLLCSHGEKG